LLLNTIAMKRLANYAILPEFGLILECCKGNATVKDSIEMKNNELSDQLYNSSYDIIVDFREFETFLDSSTSKSASDFFAFIKGLDIKGRIAFLTSEPHQVVVSMILKGLSTDSSGITIEVFSTEKAAIRFLGYPAENFDPISHKIRELSNRTG
jgi:hypothetical protein